MLLTKWQDVEEWVNTNGFKRVVLRASDKSNAGENDRSNDCLFDSRYVSGDMNTKMEHMKWILEHSDRKSFATGFQSENATTGGMIADIRLEAAAPAAPSMPVGYAPVGQLDEQAIIDRVRKEVQAEYAKQELDRERKEFERERKEFNDVKNGVMGLVVGYGKPILEAMAAKRAMVAGIDHPGHIEAEAISPMSEQEQEESPFTDEEAEELFALMERFKKVEPDYLQLIRSVVAMAESGDNMYSMAKGFLVK